MLRTGSLFSGMAGLDRAVNKYFDSTTAWHVEYDEAPSRILKHHYPDVPNFGDVTTVDWDSVEPVDILTGGYPCQPFSHAGYRQGENDERHLWPHVREAIRHLRPRYIFLENVAGHLSLGFGRVLGDMAEDGLHARWVSLRASHVGAPHHRERLFILATPADAGRFGLEKARPVPGESAQKKSRPDLCADVLPGWESVFGPAPSYVDGRGRLNPEYPEWMMGLPRGWVTSPEIGLSQAEQLKVIGNGVCPPQAFRALQILMGIEVDG